jgi:tRNA threonylcarbamoyladenosine biosynthesis protein TsaB
MNILAVDTALGACSAAVLMDGRVAARRFELMDRGHAEALAPMVEDVMRGIDFPALDRLAVTTGPGTFTGQRVGLAFMRGLRVALKKPLTGVTSLAAIAAQAMAETGRDRAAVLHDARRDEFYVEIVPGLAPAVMARTEAAVLLADFDGVLAGTGAPLVSLSKAILSEVRQPDALWVARLVLAMPATDEVPRPLYLRAPDAKLPA